MSIGIASPPLQAGARNDVILRVRDHFFPPGASVEAFSRGGAPELDAKRLRVSVAKGEESPSGRRRKVEVHLKNDSVRRATFLFGSEQVLTLKDAHVNRMGEADGIRRFSVVDPAARLEVSWAFSRPARLWHFPLESARGGERVYQGVCLVWLWPVTLASRGSWVVRWELSVGAAR